MPANAEDARNDLLRSIKDAADRADEASAKAGRTAKSEAAKEAAHGAFLGALAEEDADQLHLWSAIAERQLGHAEHEAERVRRESYEPDDRSQATGLRRNPEPGKMEPRTEGRRASDQPGKRLPSKAEQQDADDAKWDATAARLVVEQRGLDADRAARGNPGMSAIEDAKAQLAEAQDLAEQAWNVGSEAKEKAGEAIDKITEVLGAETPELGTIPRDMLTEAQAQFEQGQALCSSAQDAIATYIESLG